jgi:hypothetical protein
MKKFLILGAILAAAARLWAGTLTGSIQTASGGTVNRGTLTFNLSQPGVVSGTASIVTSQFSCYTSALGNVVAVPDPGNPVALSSNYSTGRLPAATYYVKYSLGEMGLLPETPLRRRAAPTASCKTERGVC